MAELHWTQIGMFQTTKRYVYRSNKFEHFNYWPRLFSRYCMIIYRPNFPLLSTRVHMYTVMEQIIASSLVKYNGLIYDL